MLVRLPTKFFCLSNPLLIAYYVTRMKPGEHLTFIDKAVYWIGSVPSLAVHTLLFALAFAFGIFGVASWEIVLLVLTTVVSLEAIYLAILIQMTVNRHTASLQEVEHDIDEIQEDVEELGEDVDEMQEDMEEIQEDIEEISEEEADRQKRDDALDRLEADVQRVLTSIEALKRQ